MVADPTVSSPADLGIRQALGLLRRRALSYTELFSAVAARLRDTEPQYRAYASERLDAAEQEARALDSDASQRSGGDGLLTGIPLAVKDVICTRDMPTEAGSLVLRGYRPEADAAVVHNLRASGALLIGKLVTHEFACGQDVPPTRNAWNSTHYPGGSTAGGGVSVALGSAMAAVGSDSAGSVRKPAALNGVVGYKPTLGCLSNAGVIPLSPSFDHVGLIARTVDDIRLLTVAAAGAGRDPDWIAVDVADAARGLAGVRLGLPECCTSDEALSPGVRHVFERARLQLEEAGAVLIPVTIPDLDCTLACGFTMMMGEAAGVHARWLRECPEKYHPDTRRFLELASLLPGQFLEWAKQARAVLTGRVAEAFRENELDAIVMPTNPIPSLPIDEMDIGRDLPTYVRHTIIANVTGQPAISVPSGVTEDNEPVGLQLMGKPRKDGALLALARAYEAVSDWTPLTDRLSTASAGAPAGS